jgi:hypothetical protein
MNTTIEKPKINQRARALAEFAKLLEAAESRGFYGTACITVIVQNGNIEHLRIAVDKMVK